MVNKNFLFGRYILTAFVLGLSFISFAQIGIKTTFPSIKSCIESDSVKVVFTNNGSTTVDSIQYNPELPNDVSYVLGSNRNMLEKYVTNRNKPTFSVAKRLNSGDSAVVYYVVRGGCDLDDKNKFPIVKHGTNRFQSGSSTRFSLTDTVPTFIVPDLAIASFSIPGSAYTFVGDTIEINVKLTNQSFADVRSFSVEYNVTSLELVSTSLDTGYQNYNWVYLESDSIIESKSDFEFNVKFKVTSCYNMKAFLTVPWGCEEKKCNSETTNINPNSYKTIPSVQLKLLPSDRSSIALRHPFCTEDTLRRTYINTTEEKYIKGSGAVRNVIFQLDNYREEEYVANGIVDSFIVMIGDTILRLPCLENSYLSFNNRYKRDFDGPGGFTDTDGDGYYDDIAVGDSITVRLVLKEPKSCKGIAGSQTIYDTYYPSIIFYGYDGCNRSDNAQFDWSRYYLVSGNSSNSGGYFPWVNKTNIDSSSPATIRYYFSQHLPTNCANGGKVRTYYILPPDVDISNIKSTAYKAKSKHWFAGDTLVHELTSNTADTTNPTVRIDNSPFEFDLEVNCNTLTTIWNIEYITTVICDTSCNDCEYVTRRGFMPSLFLQPCNALGLCGGPTLSEFSVERLNIGWDKDLDTIKTAVSADIIRTTFVTYDTVKLNASGNILGTGWDSLYFSYFQHVGASGKLFQPLSTEYELFDNSGKSKGSCTQIAAHDSSTGQGRTYWWNLSDVTCSAFDSLKPNDSISFSAYFLVTDSISNSTNDAYQITQNHAYFTTDSAGIVNSCNYRGTGDLTYYSLNTDFFMAPAAECDGSDPYSYGSVGNACGPNVTALTMRNASLWGLPFEDEYRPFGKFRRVKLVLTDLNPVKDSFALIYNYMVQSASAFQIPHADTIYHKRLGDTLIYEIPDSIGIPFGLGSCHHNVGSIVIPVDIRCDKGSGNYRRNTFFVDYDINLHGDTSKIKRIRNEKYDQYLHYRMSNPQVTFSTDYVDAFTDTAYWEGKVINYDDQPAPYQSFFFDDDGNDMNVFKAVVNGKDYFSKRVDSITQRIDLDTLAKRDEFNIRVYFTFTNCSKDTVTYRYGNGCYPLKKDYLDNFCRLSTGKLYVSPKPINPQIKIIEEPVSSSLDLCETMNYKIELTNSQVADGNRVQFNFLPPAGNGFSVLNDSCYFYYKNDLSKKYYLKEPTYDSSSDAYQWKLGSEYKLGGVNSSLGDYVFRISLAPNCDFRQNDFVRFQSLAFAPCQDSLTSNIATGDNIVLNNINQTIPTHYSRSTITVLEDNMCDTFSIAYTWVNTGNDLPGGAGHADPDTTSNIDFMQVRLPAGISQTPFKIVPTTSNAKALQLIDSFVLDSTLFLEIQLPSGLDKGDSLAFEVKFIPENSQTCTDSLYTSIANYFVFTSYCAVLDDTCRLEKETGFTNQKGILLDDKWEFSVQDLQLQLVADSSSDSGLAQFSILSKSTLLKEHPLHFLYVYDKNGDGSYDAGDSIVLQTMRSTTLKNGDTLNITDAFKVPSGFSCNLLLVINADTNCICSDFTSSFPTPQFANALSADSSCFPMTNEYTIGTRRNSTYSYTWSGPTSFTYDDTLEQTNILYTGLNPSNTDGFWFHRTVTLKSGCIAKDSVLFKVLRQPEIEFGPDIHHCVLDSFTFAIDPYNYDIKWSNGSTDSSIKTLSNQDVWVSIKNACGADADTVTFTSDQLTLNDVVYLSDSVQCEIGNYFNLTTTVTNNSSDTSIVTWDWLDGDTSNGLVVNHSYKKSLQDSIKIIATNGWCSDSAFKPFLVIPTPVAEFSIKAIDSCQNNNSFSFYTKNSIDSLFNYTWFLGDGTSTTSYDTLAKTYLDSGLYTVKLLMKFPGQCSDSSTQTVRVYPTPEVSYTTNDSIQCLRGNVFNFTNTSTVALGTLTSNWKLGDGSTLSSQNVTNYTYPTVSKYKTTLITTSSYGCVDSVSKNVETKPMPSASIGVNDAMQCANGNLYRFTNLSTVPSGNKSHLFDYQDGTTSSDSLPLKSFTTAGTYDVLYSITTDDNCADSQNIQLIVLDSPAIDFDIDSTEVCFTDNEFDFINTTTIPTSSLTYEWTISDGYKTTDESITDYHFAAIGNYNVGLIATSNNQENCKDTLVKQVRVLSEPNADFTINETEQCLSGNYFEFTNRGTTGGQYRYSFGDGTFSVSENPTKTFTIHGYKNVKQVISLHGSCSDSIEKLVNLRPIPYSNFTVNALDQCFNTHSFDFSLNGPLNGANDILWSFGDGRTSTDSANNDITYPSTGSYLVKVVTSTANCSDSTELTVNVFEDINVNFEGDSVCLGELVNFTNNSTIASGSISSYRWFFGDNSTSTLRAPIHKYSAIGDYSVILEATSNNGCKTSDTANAVKIYPVPNASFLAGFIDVIEEGQIVEFTSTSNGADNLVWFFYDNSTDNGITVRKTFNQSGDYQTILVASNNQGCVDTAYMDTTIKIPRFLNIPTSFSPNGDKINDTYRIPIREIPLEYSLTIYNRWGEQLFYTEDYTASWDGMYLDEVVSNGLYVYVLYLKYEGDIKTHSGTIKVMR